MATVANRSADEDKMVKYQIAAMSAEEEELKTFYAGLVSVHQDRIETLNEEIDELRAQQAGHATTET